jgi:hypothetical protein
MPFFIVSFIFFVFLNSCGSSYSDEAAQNIVSYKVTFTTTWDATTHPSSSFPSNPHFSKLVGTTHRTGYSMWVPGSLASLGIKDMAELGAVNTISSEINAAIAADHAYNLIVADSGINPSPGSKIVTFQADKNFPLLSLTSMIAPSPDWFVGIHDVALYDGYTWITSKKIELFAYDAGTDSGTTYTAEDEITNPPENIAQLKDPLQEGISLGTILIEKQ